MLALSIEEFIQMEDAPYRLIDVRQPALFIRGHLRGSWNAPFEPGRALEAPESSHPTVFVGIAGVIARRAAQSWSEAGHAAVYYLDAPFAALERALPAERLARATVVEPEALVDWQQDGRGVLLDVRLADAARQGVIPGSLAIPLPDLEANLDQLDSPQPLLAYCGSGRKAIEAAARLLSHGFSRVSVVASGGMDTWYREGRPVEAFHG